MVFDKGTDRTYVVSDPLYHKKYYSWVELGSCFRMPELNASFLQPQINDINKVITYRSNLYKRCTHLLFIGFYLFNFFDKKCFHISC